MPTYEYRCPQGHEFERFFKTISAAVPELPCPECGQTAARQMSGGAGLLFKGSGFYLTDYGKNAHRKAAPDAGKSDAAKKDASGASRSEAKSDGGGASKGESKPAPASSDTSKKPTSKSE